MSTDSGANSARDEPIGRRTSAPIGDSTCPGENTAPAEDTERAESTEPVGGTDLTDVAESAHRAREIAEADVVEETGEILGTGPADELEEMTETEPGHSADLAAESESVADAQRIDGTDVLEGSGPVDDVDPGDEVGELAGVNPFDEAGPVDGDDPVEGGEPPVGFGVADVRDPFADGAHSWRDEESEHADADRAGNSGPRARDMPEPSLSRTKSRPGLEPHAFRVTPFVFGLAFAAVGIAGLTDFSSDDTTAWLWVVALLVFGVAGIAAAFARRAEST